MDESKTNNQVVKETSDIGFAAFLLMNDLEIVNLEEQFKGRYKFKFKTTEEEFTKLKYKYPTSESRKFDSGMRQLKMMIKTEISNSGKKF